MRTPTLTPRPSSMDRAMLCPGSHYPREGEPLIEVLSDDASAIGRAAHKCLELHAMHVKVDSDAVAAKFRVTVDDIRYLSYSASQFVEWLEETFDVDEWMPEKQIDSHEIVDGFKLDGTPDLLGITRDGKTIIVFDLKTGRGESSYEHQLRSYSLAALDHANSADSVIALIGWARDADIQKWEWSREDMAAWRDDVIHTVFDWDGVKYTVGGHCTFCRRHSSCEARTIEIRSGYRIMLMDSEDGADALPELAGETFAAAWEASKTIPKMIEQWRTRIRERIGATGPIDMGNGRCLDVVERNAAPEIDTLKAVAVLKTGFGFDDEDILSVCKIGKKAMEEIICSRAPRGQKGKAKAEAIEALQENGALVPKTSRVMAVKKIVPEIENTEEGERKKGRVEDE